MRGAPHGGAGGLGAGADHPHTSPRPRFHTLGTLSTSLFRRAVAPARELPEPYTAPPITCAHSFHAAAATSMHDGPIPCRPHACKTPASHDTTHLGCCGAPPTCPHATPPTSALMHTCTPCTLHSHYLTHRHFRPPCFGGCGEGSLSGFYKTTRNSYESYKQHNRPHAKPAH